MNLAVNLNHWNSLVAWKRRALRNVMGDLNLGEPARYDANGTPVAVFSDARFTPEHAYALGLVMVGIASLPDEAPSGATPQDGFDAAGVPQNSAQFLETLPGTWTPIESP